MQSTTTKKEQHQLTVARPLGRRFILWVVCALLVSALISFFFAYVLYESHRSTAAKDQLESHVESLRPTIERSLWEVNSASLEAILEAISARQEVRSIRLTDLSIQIQYPRESTFESCSATLSYDFSDEAPYGRRLGSGLLEFCLQRLPFSSADFLAVTNSVLLHVLGSIGLAAFLFFLARKLIVARLEDMTQRLRSRSGPFTVSPEKDANSLDEIDLLEQELANSTIRLREAADKLSEAHKMKALGTLTGGVAHEFNNLLAVIQGNLDLLLLLTEERNPNELKGLVDDALGATASASDLVSELLYFSRPANKIAPCSLSTIRDIARDRIEPFLRPEIEVSFDLEAEGLVRADKEALARALVNLIKNAIEASPEVGNEITITIRRSAASEVDKFGAGRRYFTFDVCDAGPGVPEALRSRLFEPFFSTKQAMRGVGLGLWAVYNFCQNSQGSIEYLPLSPGSCFRILLPESLEPAEQAASAGRQANLSKDFTGFRLLIVDDEETICSILYTFFDQYGAQVTVENCAGDAIETIRNSEPFDGLVCDYLLPDGIGTEVVEAAKIKGSTTRCIMISGNPDRKAIDDPNLHAVFIKPVNMDELAMQLVF